MPSKGEGRRSGSDLRALPSASPPRASASPGYVTPCLGTHSTIWERSADHEWPSMSTEMGVPKQW